MSIARFFRELSHPEQKCQRVGHRMISVETPVYLYPPAGGLFVRAVADRALEVHAECRRCAFRTETSIAKRRGIQGLNMPSRDWDKLIEDGRLVSR